MAKGFLNHITRPSNGQVTFLNYVPETGAFISTAKIEMIKPGDEMVVALRDMRFRWRIAMQPTLERFEPIPDNDPDLIPPAPSSEHVFEIAVRIEHEGIAYGVSSHSAALKAGLNTLYTAAGDDPNWLLSSPVVRYTGTTVYREWRQAGQPRVALQPVFEIIGWHGLVTPETVPAVVAPPALPDAVVPAAPEAASVLSRTPAETLLRERLIAQTKRHAVGAGAN